TKMLFDNRKNYLTDLDGVVDFSFFSDEATGKAYLEYLINQKWQVLKFTPSKYNNDYYEKYYQIDCPNPHDVIGQEFDKVAIAIDKLFYYDNNGILKYKINTHYDPVGMLYQNATRSKEKLRIVIINNKD